MFVFFVFVNINQQLKIPVVPIDIKTYRWGFKNQSLSGKPVGIYNFLIPTAQNDVNDEFAISVLSKLPLWNLWDRSLLFLWMVHFQCFWVKSLGLLRSVLKTSILRFGPPIFTPACQPNFAKLYPLFTPIWTEGCLDMNPSVDWQRSSGIRRINLVLKLLKV